MGLLLQKTKIHWKASTVLQHDTYVYSTILRMGCACPSTAKSNFTFIRSWNASSYTTTLLRLSGGSGVKVYLFSYRKDGLKELVSIQYTQVTGQSFLNSAICTKVGFTHLWGFEIHVLAESCEILYQGYHQGNISRLFLEMRGGKYLLKKS